MTLDADHSVSLLELKEVFCYYATDRITDIVMQSMKGLQLTKQVKFSWPNTNVIVMAGVIDDYSYDQAIEAGASDFIKKPFTVHEMMVRIKQVMRCGRCRSPTS
jgi:DNA-binding NtrC family response regulator